MKQTIVAAIIFALGHTCAMSQTAWQLPSGAWEFNSETDPRDDSVTWFIRLNSGQMALKFGCKPLDRDSTIKAYIETQPRAGYKDSRIKIEARADRRKAFDMDSIVATADGRTLIAKSAKKLALEMRGQQTLWLRVNTSIDSISTNFNLKEFDHFYETLSNKCSI